MRFFRKIPSYIDDASLNWKLWQHHRWVMTQGQEGVQADYVGKNLSQRILIIVDFRQAKLATVNLSETALFRTDFTGADLSDANLQGSMLFCANLTGARLEGADFTNATFGQTILSDVDLSRCKGLESVKHSMPSPIGIDTLFKSRGHIPRSFLVGCGVPDSLIEYLPSHISAGRPGSFFSCFISHSSKDARFCERLYDRIRQAGLRAWYAPYDMRSGQHIDDQIETAIRIFDKLLLVLSPHSMESHWVRREIKKARMRERHEQRRVLFPLRLVTVDKLKSWECLDPDTGEDLAEEIRRFHIPDFSHSDDRAFDKALGRLLEDLRSLHATNAT